MTLQGARVWLTGASSGIGEALVPLLASRGGRVAVTARRADRLETLAQTWRRTGAQVLIVPADVTDRDAVIAAARTIEDAWGGIDLALFNAGGHPPPSGAGFDSAQFVGVMALNYFSVIYGIDAVLPGMLARGTGTIAAVASLAGYRAVPTAAAYGAAKAAVIHALDSMRFDLEPHGIQLVTINPGFVKSPLTDRNRFKMPFLMDVGDAARLIVAGLERGRREIHFPGQLSWSLKVLRLLPYPLYSWIIQRATGGQRATRGSLAASSRR
jgi:NADP-dependent 3-hydroxy acid dehydrogenase YdfG